MEGSWKKLGSRKLDEKRGKTVSKQAWKKVTRRKLEGNWKNVMEKETGRKETGKKEAGRRKVGKMVKGN